MTPIEFRTRRKAFGLSQEEMGRCIALVSPMADGSERPAVKQTTIARWEGGRGLPEWADMEMHAIFGKLERVLAVMCDDITQEARDAIEATDANAIGVDAYGRDVDLWGARPQWKGWPAALWNLAAMHAADKLADELSVEVELVEAAAA